MSKVQTVPITEGSHELLERIEKHPEGININDLAHEIGWSRLCIRSLAVCLLCNKLILCDDGGANFLREIYRPNPAAPPPPPRNDSSAPRKRSPSTTWTPAAPPSSTPFTTPESYSPTNKPRFQSYLSERERNHKPKERTAMNNQYCLKVSVNWHHDEDFVSNDAAYTIEQVKHLAHNLFHGLLAMRVKLEVLPFRGKTGMTEELVQTVLARLQETPYLKAHVTVADSRRPSLTTPGRDSVLPVRDRPPGG